MPPIAIVGRSVKFFSLSTSLVLTQLSLLVFSHIRAPWIGPPSNFDALTYAGHFQTFSSCMSLLPPILLTYRGSLSDPLSTYTVALIFFPLSLWPP